MAGKRFAGTVGALAASVVALATAPAAFGVSAETAIGNLNAQRAANGIPAGITADPLLSQGCAEHNSYMQQNGGQLVHEEVAGNPGFTTAGQQAGQQSVLASGTQPWSSPAHNPWETAPIHLTQLLDPSLLISGYDESSGFACAVTLAPTRRPEPAAPKIYTYPGPKGKIYSAERAAEGPFTPGELVGIPQGTMTGPYIYVIVDGISPFDAQKPKIASSSVKRLVKRKGKTKSVKVTLKVIDSSDPRLSQYIPPGGMLIPVKRLRKGKYKASVAVNTSKGPLRANWKFRAV